MLNSGGVPHVIAYAPSLAALAAGGVAQAGADVVLCQFGAVGQDFVVRHASGEIGEHISDGDAHTPNGGLPAALARLQRDDVLIGDAHEPYSLLSPLANDIPNADKY